MIDKCAFIFPGQASQEVGMGEDLYREDSRVRDMYDAAESYLGFPLKRISFSGPLTELSQTQITQPAIFVMSCAVDMLLKERGIIPAAAAGHSLGEFSALVSAGSISFEAGLKLVKLRGKLMQKAGEIQSGTMAAIIGLEAQKVEQCCKETEGIVIPANYNSPGQLVISGEVDAVERAMERCKNAGAKIVKKLKVSGAFHSPLMEYAAEELFDALDDTDFNEPNFPVYHNVCAEPANSVDDIRDYLKKQLLNPVIWETTIRNMRRLTDTFIEVGPGKVLTGLVKRIDRSIMIFNAGSISEIEDIYRKSEY